MSHKAMCDCTAAGQLVVKPTQDSNLTRQLSGLQGARGVWHTHFQVYFLLASTLPFATTL